MVLRKTGNRWNYFSVASFLVSSIYETFAIAKENGWGPGEGGGIVESGVTRARYPPFRSLGLEGISRHA